MKLLKIMLWLVVLLVVGLVVVGFSVDGLAKSAIETAGTEALGTKTTVKSVDIGLFSGTVTLEQKEIANPDGHGGGNFFELGKGSVEVSAASLLSDKIEVPKLELSKIRVNLIQGLKGSNYGTILDNLKKFQGEPDAEKATGEGKRFIIKKLVIDDIELDVSPVKELGIKPVKLPIERIELDDVGSESDKGVLLSELAGIVIEAILKRASVSGGLPGAIRSGLNGQLPDLKGLADAGIKKLPVPEGVPTNLDDAKDKVKKGLKGLLGR